MFLVNRKLLQALNYYAIADTPNGGVGVRYDSALRRGRIDGTIGDNVGPHPITIWTMRSPPPVISTSSSPSTAGPSRGSGGATMGLLRRYQMDAATGNPTPIKVMGTRYAYAYGLPDSNLVLSLDSDVTAN